MTDGIVRKSFNRAATSYAATARLQQQVAEQLVRTLSESTPHDFSGTLLDAGCGTGYCLTQLATYYPAATLIGVDFADAMLRSVPAEVLPYPVNADLQRLPLANNSIDIYLSSLAWQWCNLETSIREAARVLRPCGHLWVTTLVAGTFDELRSCLNDAGLSPESHLLVTPEKDQVLAAVRQSSLHIHAARCETLTTFHPSFNDLRRSIRGVGANHLPVTATQSIGRIQRQRLVDVYEAQRTSHGLPLTYYVLTIHAQRC